MSRTVENNKPPFIHELVEGQMKLTLIHVIYHLYILRDHVANSTRKSSLQLGNDGNLVRSYLKSRRC